MKKKKLRYIAMMLEHEGERMSQDPSTWYWLYAQLGNRSESLSHYLQRHIMPLRFETEGYNQWIVMFNRNPKNDAYFFGDNLMIDLPFDEAEYRALPVEVESQNEYFIRGFLDGLERTMRTHTLPEEEIRALIQQFRDGGYKNRWVHKKKSFRERKLKCRIEVELTLTKFEARLIAERSGETVLNEVIQRLNHPDPSYRSRDMRGIRIENGNLVVYDWYEDKSMFETPIDAIAGLVQ